MNHQTLAVNRECVPLGEIIACVAQLVKIAETKQPIFDSMALGQKLRDALPEIAGKVSDDTMSVLMCVAAELLHDGNQRLLADHLATVAVAKAKKGSA